LQNVQRDFDNENEYNEYLRVRNSSKLASYAKIEDSSGIDSQFDVLLHDSLFEFQRNSIQMMNASRHESTT
jgi:hypothetical protein